MIDEPKSEILNGLWVGLSGAVPDPEERARQGCSEFDILDTVRRLATRVLSAGGNIVYGSHPTFTAVIDRVAEGLFTIPQPNRIRMFVGRRFFYPQSGSGDVEELFPLHSQEQYQKRHERFNHLEWVGGAHESRQEALDKLRTRFVSEAAALVCIGGKGPREGKAPGVRQEADLAVKFGKPVFLVARLGGYTRTIYEEWKQSGRLASNLQNELTEAENAKLAEPIPPEVVDPPKPDRITAGDIIDLILKGLAQLRKNDQRWGGGR